MATQIQVPYRPFPVHEGFHRTTAREKAAFGAVGSGKTIALCADALAWALDPRFPGRRVMVCRKSIPSLRDTTEAELVGLMSTPADDEEGDASTTTLWDICTPRRAGGHIDRIYLPNGSEILFRSLDDWRKIMSLNLSYIAIDEASEIDEMTYVNLMSRLRQKQPTPAARRMGYKWYGEPAQQMAIALNPEGHNWAWEYYVNNPTAHREYFRSSSFDNPTLYNADGTPSAYLTSLLSMPMVWVRRYVFCEFDAFEGQIYPFAYDRHVHHHFDPPEDWERGMGLDWGMRSPTHVGWWARKPGTHKWFKYREWQTYDHTDRAERETHVSMSVHQVASQINAIERGEKIKWRGADPMIWRQTPTDMDKRTIAHWFGVYGLHFQPGAKGYSDRINAVTQLLENDNLSISMNCPITQVAYQQYRWSDLKVTRTTDAPERPHKKDDHPCDADQYLFTLFTNSRPIEAAPRIKTQDEIIRENIKNQLARKARRRLVHSVGPE